MTDLSAGGVGPRNFTGQGPASGRGGNGTARPSWPVRSGPGAARENGGAKIAGKPLFHVERPGRLAVTGLESTG
jgi:hypothetical protein